MWTVLLAPASGLAQACPPDRDDVVLTAPSRVAPDVPITVGVGVDHVTVGSCCDCTVSRTPRVEAIELQLADNADGPWRTIVRTHGREVRWSPDRRGLVWIRAISSERPDALATEPRSVLVSDAEVEIRVQATRAVLEPAAARVAIESDARGVLRLPRVEAFWRLEGRGSVSWARVESDGRVALTPAGGAIEWTIDDVVPAGWRISVEAPGIPPRRVLCRGHCRTDDLPIGPVTVRVSGGSAEVAFVRTASARTSAERLCGAHLLAGIEPPSGGCGPLSSWPEATLGAGGGRRASTVCDASEPVDTSAGTLRIGAVVCVDRGAERSIIPIPTHVVRAPGTRPIAIGERAIWAEAETAPPFRVSVLATSGAGLAVTSLSLPRLVSRPGDAEERCIPSFVTAQDDASVVIGTCRTADDTRSRGFIARWTGRWEVTPRPSAPTAAIAHARELLIAEGSDLLRCQGRCRYVARTRHEIAALAEDGSDILVIARDGSVSRFDGRRVVSWLPSPGLGGLSISRVVSSDGRLVALFGPRDRAKRISPLVRE